MLSTLSRPWLHQFLSLRQLCIAAPRALASEPRSSALSFEDPRAFRVKTLGELVRALGIFRLCSLPVLVDHCAELMSVAQTLLGRRGFSLLLRPSVYSQFVAGETEKEISTSMEKLSILGLRPMLAVPIEDNLGDSTGEQCYDDNMMTMLECVRMSHSNVWSKDPMMQLKITALLSPEICTKVTSLLSQQPYPLDLVVMALDGEPIQFPGLDERENNHFLCGLKRLDRIAKASVHKVRVLVDAEYTYMNPALSLVTMAMMKKYNQDGAWIWNTYQCYLKESSSLLREALHLSVCKSFCLGVKLVRGAYMDTERKLARERGHTDPIHECWEETNHSYNSSLDTMLEVISQNPQGYRIIVATHNEESVKRAAQRMEELGIDKDEGSVSFGQLLGMCDHVSLTLAQQGYSVYKSVPYGSVADTLPYLVRRAQENRAVLQGIRKERDLLRLELRRRLRLCLWGGH